LRVDSKPVVFDLPGVHDLAEFLEFLAPKTTRRIFLFFGMLPNFEPNEALRPLEVILRHDDLLLVSANLAPGPDYATGVKKILPLYDNDLTRRWLATVLLDTGLEVFARQYRIRHCSGKRVCCVSKANFRFKINRQSASMAKSSIMRRRCFPVVLLLSPHA